mgnify:CR=1 FL=1
MDGTIGESIGMFSTKTQELFASWQNGGATQKQVIDSIVRISPGVQTSRKP